jgi:TetR/AcrR family transcriptional regulator, regulator of autoinduction and epiphytic fitness
MSRSIGRQSELSCTVDRMPARSTSTKQSPARSRRIDPRIAETQRLVKEATLDLIAEIGFEGTTVELIAERSGVSRTTIYRHWPDPAVLFLEAFDPTTPARQPPTLTGDFTTDLDAYIHHVVERLNDERFVAALAAQIDKARRDPQYREAHLQYAVTRNEHGRSIFLAGKADGTLRDDIDPEHETDLILSFLVYQRIMKYRRLDNALVGALRNGVLARCLRPVRRSARRD